MGNYFEPVLSEEQIAAYLDGMLSTEESNMVEELIDSSPEMVEIQDAIDSVDVSYLYDINDEIPIECMADDFSLPDVGYGDHHNIDSYDAEEYLDAEGYNEDFTYQDISDDSEYQDEMSETIHDDSFVENGYDDISF